jgi:chromosome partitioning protein
MIYTIGGIKGGCGKTTVATNLTILMAAEGRDVLLVDADDQETATDFTAWRNQTTQGNTGYTAIQLTGDAVRTETLKFVSKYDDIVIDTGGRDTTSQRAALTVTDTYLYHSFLAPLTCGPWKRWSDLSKKYAPSILD